jgi:hypothetical protein
LTLALGYIERLVSNTRVEKYLAKHHGDTDARSCSVTCTVGQSIGLGLHIDLAAHRSCSLKEVESASGGSNRGLGSTSKWINRMEFPEREREARIEVKIFTNNGRMIFTSRELHEAARDGLNYFVVGLLDDGRSDYEWRSLLLQNPLALLLSEGSSASTRNWKSPPALLGYSSKFAHYGRLVRQRIMGAP